MKNLLKGLLGLILILSFTSCFEIVEEVDMNKDGSGQLLLTINGSESKQNLANYSKMKDFQGMPIPTESMVREEMDKVLGLLKQQKGLSDIKMTKDFKEFVFTLSGKFDNTTALNNAVNTVIKELNPRNKKPIKRIDNYKSTSSSFHRLYPFPSFPERYKTVSILYKALLESARFVTVQRFQKPIKKKTNKAYQLSENKKAVFMMSNLGELIQGQKTLDNRVTF